MKQFLTQVTVTGADDSVRISDLVEIQKQYPFAEFGILLSRDSMGRIYRFPSMEWIDELKHYKDELNLSGHVCGRWTKEFLVGKHAPDFDKLVSYQLFKRWQFNTHGYRHAFDFYAVLSWINSSRLLHEKVILQYDKKNDLLLNEIRKVDTSLVQVLYDLSGGNGVLPDAWDKPMGDFECGYAGGLSPTNVKDQLNILADIVGDHKTWIDAETHVRSEDDSVFDLEKVVSFLENSKERVIKA